MHPSPLVKPIERGRRTVLLVCQVLCWAVAAVFALLCPVSYFRYTTLGIDTDQAEGATVYYSYYRIRWQGDGSFRVGSGAHRYQSGTKPLEPFDLGGRFFQRPRREPIQSVWNQIGFWWQHTRWEDEVTRANSSRPRGYQFWVGVPSILPALLFGGWAWGIRRRLRPSIPPATLPTVPPEKENIS